MSQDPFALALSTFRRTFDPFGAATSLWEVQRAWLDNPSALSAQLARLVEETVSVQSYAALRLLGFEHGDLIPAQERDERFQDPVWTDNPVLDVLKQYYLLGTRWLEDAIFATPGVSAKTQRRAAFWARQVLNALAPNNFFWSNPRALQRFLETGGQSLAQGWENWLRDLQRGDVPMVRDDAFQVGVSLANTPGQVVLRNPLLELIQYSPTTRQVHALPVLIAAPWINKYYILDLNPAKSLIRFLVERGFTVFVTSWKNPTVDMRGTRFEDYLTGGLLPAIEAARAITGSQSVHAVGYCIGGTLLTALMAWLEQTGDASSVSHWTQLTTLADFANPGDIDVFIDEESVAAIERSMAARGYLDGGEMALSFRMLRANSLFWNYFIQNYLYGEEPPPFDVLYWNMDSTRLPETMHSYYLRELYLQNRLVQPGGIRLAGQALDLSRIRAPLYAVGTEQDHIAPWKETFKITGLVQSPVRYVLATSGHILGIISPPVDPPKRRYWVGDVQGTTDPEVWRGASPKRPGSWWEDWVQWLGERCAPLVEPPALGNASYPPLGPAPGGYVLER